MFWLVIKSLVVILTVYDFFSRENRASKLWEWYQKDHSKEGPGEEFPKFPDISP